MNVKYQYGIGFLATLAVLTACQDPVPTPADEAGPTLRPGEVRTLDEGPYCGWERMNNVGHYWEKYSSGTTLSWTPDGDYIIFDNRHKIMRVSTDGTQLEVLINTHPRKFEQEPPRARHQSHASLSRDGKKFAYSTCQFTAVIRQPQVRHAGMVEVKGSEITKVRMHIGELAIADADGSNQIRLTKEGAVPRLPTWSPDGTKIAFTEALRWDYMPIVMLADGSDRVPWSKLGPTQTEDPSLSWDELYASRMHALMEPPVWSPDSSKILVRGEFTGEDHHSVGRGVGEVGHLYKLDLQEESVADLGLSISGPSWSPDGGRIAFTHLKGEEVLISSMRMTGAIDRKSSIWGFWMSTCRKRLGEIMFSCPSSGLPTASTSCSRARRASESRTWPVTSWRRRRSLWNRDFGMKVSTDKYHCEEPGRRMGKGLRFGGSVSPRGRAHPWSTP